MSISDDLDIINAASDRIRAASAPSPSTRLVKAGESLPAALASGVPLTTEAGAIFPGSMQLRSGTRLTFGAGSGIQGGTGPAVVMAPRTTDVRIQGGLLATKHNDVLQWGENTAAQRSLVDEPRGLELVGVTINHRGKRGLSLHGHGWRVLHCDLEVWSTTGEDTQAVYVGNSSGDGYAEGGIWTAGSEIFLAGGDSTQIAGVVPDGLTFKGVTFKRPLSWKTDGLKRKVKNSFELKNARHVLVEDCTIDGCWTDGQTGEAFVFTPALDGATTAVPLPSGIVEDVTVRNCDVRNVSAICGMIGRSYGSYTATKATRILFEGNRLQATKTLVGTGQLLKVGGEPGVVTFTRNQITVDGSSLIYFYRGTTLEADGTKHPGGNWERLTFTENTVGLLGAYSINVDGAANALNWQSAIAVAEVTGNTFRGSALLKKQFPDNVYA